MKNPTSPIEQTNERIRAQRAGLAERRYIRAEPHPAELDATQMRDGSWRVWSHEVWHGERSGLSDARMSLEELEAYVAGWSAAV